MLEPRLLFSSATATVASDGTLIINGTPARERIRVMLWLDLSGGAWRITINGHAPHLHPPSSPDWPYWLPSALVIRAAGGNDSIKVDTPLGEVPTTILAGDGDDTITTDARHTIIFGGNGNDKITVDSNDADPNSIVFGGDGDDLITGSDKANYLHGGNGNDTLIGGGGNDQLFGEAGNDVLEGGDGIDTFFGGDGRDKILSGDANGDEPVDGGNGFDLVYFPNDCSVPWDDMVSIYRINVIGTDRWWFCMI